MNLKEESPDSKRLREPSQWGNDVIKEGEQDSGSEGIDTLPKDESEVSEAITESEERPFEEAVWVERNGEWQRLSDSS